MKGVGSQNGHQALYISSHQTYTGGEIRFVNLFFKHYLKEGGYSYFYLILTINISSVPYEDGVVAPAMITDPSTACFAENA